MFRTICKLYKQFSISKRKTQSFTLKRRSVRSKTEMFQTTGGLRAQILSCSENSRIGRKDLGLDRRSAMSTGKSQIGREVCEVHATRADCAQTQPVTRAAGK